MHIYKKKLYSNSTLNIWSQPKVYHFNATSFFALIYIIELTFLGAHCENET